MCSPESVLDSARKGAISAAAASNVAPVLSLATTGRNRLSRLVTMCITQCVSATRGIQNLPSHLHGNLKSGGMTPITVMLRLPRLTSRPTTSVGVEQPLPQPVTDDHDGRSAGAVFFRREDVPDLWLNSKQGKQIGGRLCAEDTFRFIADEQRRADLLISREILNGRRLCFVVEEVRI